MLEHISVWVDAFSKSLPHIEGMLHLAALAVAISAVYLGVDRIHNDDHGIQKFLDNTRESVRKHLVENGYVITNNRVKYLPHIVRQLAILSAIADWGIAADCFWDKLKIKVCVSGFPFLWYFRRRIDRVFVSVFGVFSTIFLLFGVGSTVFCYQISPWTVAGCFSVFSLGLVWIFLTAAFSYKLWNIEEVYKSTITEVENETKKTISELEGQIENLSNLGKKP